MSRKRKTTVFITGASRGIGRALALEYTKRDCEVFLFARNRTALEELTQYIKESGGCAYFYAGDVTVKNDVANAVEEAVTQMGNIDIAFLNAGISAEMPFSEFNADIFTNVFNVNLIGNLYCFEYIIPVMKRQGAGKIVGISSIASFRPVPGSSPYTSSKIAFDYLLESARYELESFGIKVITVRFGFIRTDIVAKADYPLPFLMEAEDCARKVADGVDAGKRKVQFPLPMVLLTKFLKILPESIYKQIVKFRLK